MTLIPVSEYQRMPWSNGLGQTSQITIEPPSARFPTDRFVWRLSAADVSAKNSFSRFAGYRRWLAVWRGKGLRLNKDDLKLGTVTEFSGEHPIDCDLLEGPVTDLGLIYDPLLVRARMQFLGSQDLDLGEGTHFLFNCGEETAVCETAVKAEETLRIEGPQKLRFEKVATRILWTHIVARL